MRATAVCLTAAVTMAMMVAYVATAQEVHKIDVAKLGPQVGEKVPDFRLPDQRGTMWTLKSAMGPRGAMLVFYRSADWCPYCKTQLLELQSQYAKLQKQGLGLVAISYDSREILDAFSEQHGITFPMLSDVGSATIRRYGILNTVAEEAVGPHGSDPDVAALAKIYVAGTGATARMAGIPFPGTFIVDRSGRVTSRFFEDSYTVRNTVSKILLKADGADTQVTGTRIATAQLDLTTYPSDSAVAPGNRFSIALDITPHSGMHVYAPGASGYKVIGLTITPTTYLHVEPMKYPPSEIWNFKPLNERVPTYQRRFTLVQDLTVDAQAVRSALRDQTSLTITGELNYQACDDRICYNPQTVPLTWTVGLRPIVTQPTTRPATR